MYKIVLIGAGQLGSRHLQALVKSKLDISIEVVEPDNKSVEIARQRFNEIGNNNKVELKFYNSIDYLSEKIDVAIVATNSNVRYEVSKTLLETKNVKYLILEKVLFQQVEHYYLFDKLLSKTETKCWVNHPRRMFPFYHSIQQEMKDAHQINFEASGGDWGLACNGLHLIDLFSYLSGENIIDIVPSYLEKQVYSSKRNDFIEFKGKLTGTIGSHMFSLYSGKEISPFYITISSEKFTAFIDETNGFARISKKSNDWTPENIKTKIVYFQSELTQLIVENILNDQKCDLPTYQQAMTLHVPYIQTLLNFMKQLDGVNHNVCPIT